MDKRTVSGAAVPVDLAKEWERIEALQAPRGWKRMRSEEVGVGVRRARVRRLNGGEMDLLDRLLLLLAPFPSPASPSSASASASASAASPCVSSMAFPDKKKISGEGESSPSFSSSYILRNLTKRLFVRDSVLARSPRYRYSLGEVLCTRVLWTQDPSGTMGLGCRGKWAGDRFDIVRGEECGVADEEMVEKGEGEGEDEEQEFYEFFSSIYRRDEEEEDGRDETMPWKDVSAAAVRRLRRAEMRPRMDEKRC